MRTKIKDKVYYDENYRVVLHDAEIRLKNRCLETAQAKYGNPLPDFVKSRLDIELEAIITNHHSSAYLTVAMIADQSRLLGYPVTTRGTIGSSFVAYLLGISHVNPLPAHYYCPLCQSLELVDVDYQVMGFDLPDKVCPECGTILAADGCNIEPEILMGIDLEKEPDFTLNLASEVRPKLIRFIKDMFGQENVFRAGVKAVLENGDIRRNVHPGGIFIVPKGTDITTVTDLRAEIPDDDFQLLVTDTDYHELDGSVLKKIDLLVLPELSMIKILEERTGVPASSIRKNDEEVITFFRQVGSSFLPGRQGNGQVLNKTTDLAIKESNPGCFSDLVRIAAMLHGTGTWYHNGEELVRRGKSLRECIATRDDFFQKLLTAGATKTEAFTMMDTVRKGKRLNDIMRLTMELADIPEYYIQSAEKVSYLYPKAQVAEYMMVYMKLGFYRLHFPDEYWKAMEEALKTIPKDPVGYVTKAAPAEERSDCVNERIFLEKYREAQSNGKEPFSFSRFCAMYPDVVAEMHQIEEQYKDEDEEFRARKKFLCKSHYAYMYYVKFAEAMTIAGFVRMLKEGKDGNDQEGV